MRAPIPDIIYAEDNKLIAIEVEKKLGLQELKKRWICIILH
jgi:hypothetical protein